ncbi:hypothetical protein Tco_0194713 [Tanacetum coccineum]
MGALATIQEGKNCTEEINVKADVFLHQHINEMLELEYSNCDDPNTLWKDLEIRFNNQREVYLPVSRDEWNNLRDNQLIAMKNLKVVPQIDSTSEANVLDNDDNNTAESQKRRCGYNGRSRGCGRGRGQRNNTYHVPQVNNFNQKNNEVGTFQNHEGSCFRYGGANRWSKACLKPSHLCELYQASRKGKEKEVNHVDQFDNTNPELVGSNFFDDLEL